MLRLFIGLELPVSIQNRLEPLCSGLKDVRWVAPENMHITLSFIGDIAEGAAEDLHEKLCGLSFEPFELSLAETGCFESRGRARAVWADVKGDVEALHRLHHKIQLAVETAGLTPERRKYKPHVTLGWLKGTPLEKLQAFMSAHNTLKTSAFRVSHFSLFQSHLSRHGADYEVLERYGPSDPEENRA